jgi:hypothetical protein
MYPPITNPVAQAHADELRRRADRHSHCEPSHQPRLKFALRRVLTRVAPRIKPRNAPSHRATAIGAGNRCEAPAPSIITTPQR